MGGVWVIHAKLRNKVPESPNHAAKPTMYNGIGLLTPRGSGTSGYVQTNKFNLRGGPPMRAQPGGNISDMQGPKKARADPSILEHRAKREIELKVAEEQAKLEDEG